MPFDEVLKIIKSYYIQKEFKERDSILYRLDVLIMNFEQTNPFDILKKNQKYFFNNVRYKSGQDYLKIESDIKEIVKEIDSQNKLVDEYLNNAKDAYDNSKLAMSLAFFSLLTTLFINLAPWLKKKKVDNSKLGNLEQNSF